MKTISDDCYANTSTTTTRSESIRRSAIRQSVDPWNLGLLLVRKLSVCRESVVFTADMGARSIPISELLLVDQLNRGRG
jgi:hypothetical protein